jgi:hypothetical protein
LINPLFGTQLIDTLRDIEYTITEEGIDPLAGHTPRGIEVNRSVKYRAIGIIVGSIMIFIAVWRLLRKREGK